jgi:hypothetical protein
MGGLWVSVSRLHRRMASSRKKRSNDALLLAQGIKFAGEEAASIRLLGFLEKGAFASAPDWRSVLTPDRYGGSGQQRQRKKFYTSGRLRADARQGSPSNGK